MASQVVEHVDARDQAEEARPVVHDHHQPALEDRDSTEALTGTVSSFWFIGAARQYVPDLIVLDMTMPELDGAEVVRRVRAQGLSVPILLTSGNVDPALERRLEPGSFQGFLRKPFSLAELMAAIEGLLGTTPTP